MASSTSRVLHRFWFGALLATLVLMLSAPRLEAAPASPLVEYYAHKYPEWHKQLVKGGVDVVFDHASPLDRRQAMLEVLAFSHVVYHPTRSHHIENNFALMKQYHDEIMLACERFGVPPAMAFAIISWENSGSTAATSYAACVGMGQLSDAAMQQAHRLSARFARVDIAAEGFCVLMANVISGFGGENTLTRALRSRAAALDIRAHEFELGTVHSRLARGSGVKDERAIPRANIEDSVVYMRYLLEMYGGRADLAISAYHNGVANTDDLLRDYLRRTDPASSHFTMQARGPLFAALTRQHISYITLWNDLRCHQMLNGLRTMDGDITTPANAREAMGDESDIYVWKTLGSLAGTHATPSQVTALLARYHGEQSEAETADFAPGTDVISARGLRVTRELAGYLDSLERRLQAQTHGKVKPVLAVTAVHESNTHRSGLAVDLTVSDTQVAKLLNEDWLFDRIYKTRLNDGRMHICLNPRYGREFLHHYEASKRSADAAAAR